MNEIRKNKEEEVEVVSAEFATPKFLKVLIFILIGVCLVAGIVLLCVLFSLTKEMESVTNDFNGNNKTDGVTILSYLLNIVEVAPLFAIAAVLFGLLKSLDKSCKNAQCIVTNKSIKGTPASIIAKKSFNYRLDEIDNIEMQSFLGIHTLVLNFSQGKLAQNNNVNYRKGILGMQGANVFRISCIENYEEVYDKLSGLLASVKNDKDVAIDIEMRKVEAEDRKAAAFEMVASKLGSTETKQDDSLTKLERLVKLKENGAISEEEYNKKKEEILKYI